MKTVYTNQERADQERKNYFGEFIIEIEPIVESMLPENLIYIPAVNGTGAAIRELSGWWIFGKRTRVMKIWQSGIVSSYSDEYDQLAEKISEAIDPYRYLIKKQSTLCTERRATE